MIVETPGLHILIVDDNVDVADVLVTGLQRFGHRPISVSTAREALLAIAQAPPDVVIIDISLGDMDGWRLAESICALGLHPRPRLLALSGLDDEGDRARSFDVGFEEHLVKPVRMTTLDALLRGPRVR